MARSRTTAHDLLWGRTGRNADGLTTAFLLPDLHPWLKEYFADRNLVPIEDEAWDRLPAWESIPEYRAPEAEPESSIQYSVFSIRYQGPEIPKLVRTRMAPVQRTESPVSHTAPSLTPALSASEAIPNTEYRIPNTSYAAVPPPPPVTIISPPQEVAIFANGEARRSTAPVPFVVPVYATTAPAPSRHLLRLTRPRWAHPVTKSPNLLTSFLASRVERVGAPLNTPAPTYRIPAPYDELLIVNVVLGPLGVLWRSIGWPLLVSLGIMNHESRMMGLVSGIARRVTKLKLYISTSWLSRTSAEALFRMQPARERHEQRPAWASGRSVINSQLRFRPAFAFAAVLFLVLLPLKLFDIRAGFPAMRGRVLGATADAFGAFRSGGQALTQSSFADAVAAFDRARMSLEGLPAETGVLGRMGLSVSQHVPGLSGAIGRAEAGRRAGIALAAASSAATRGLATLEQIDLAQPRAATLVDAAAASFASARIHAEGARTHLRRAAPAFVPPVDRAIGELRRAERLLPILKALGGIDRPRRLLLAFQNPAELRPTGGFIGSVALVDVADGSVETLELPGGGSYDISGISRLRVVPPEPLRLLRDTWQFQDANWFPDFPTSARKLRSLYEASGGPTVDAVVAVNAPLLERILELTGPIVAGGKTFSSTAAVAMLTNTIESDDARATGQPKAILAELAPEIFHRLLAITTDGAPTQRLQLLDQLLRALDERDVLLAFTDDAVQSTVIEARWSGEVRTTPRDYLFVTHANIGGGKSDAVIRDDLTHTASILEDGSVVNTVVITRAHAGTPAPPNAPASERLAGLANVDYVRLYVPRGSTLLTADGFAPPPASAFEPIPTDAIPDRLLLSTELAAAIDPASGARITEEFGKTAFAGWMQIPPGETRTLRFVYRLPWQYERTRPGIVRKEMADPQSYSLLVQKQSGTRATVRHTIELAPTWRSTWSAENLQAAGPNTWTFSDILTSDRFTGMMVAPRP
ncbi:MAG: DUF4012 domain-containing protein [bacterium]|nr:DUF4012 domain-containing protein [bacterium]